MLTTKRLILRPWEEEDAESLYLYAKNPEIGPTGGPGLIPEAVCELIRYGFEEICLKTIWCGYFDGNEKSKRVQEKCGFRYHHTEKDKPWPLMGDVRTEHISCITKEQYSHFCAE